MSPSYNINSLSPAIYDEDSSARNDSPTAVKMMINDMNNTVYFTVIDAESSADNTESSAIIMMTTAFLESPFAIHDKIPSTSNNYSAAAVTLKLISFELDTNDDDDSTKNEATFTIAVI